MFGCRVRPAGVVVVARALSGLRAFVDAARELEAGGSGLPERVDIFLERLDPRIRWVKGFVGHAQGRGRMFERPELGHAAVGNVRRRRGGEDGGEGRCDDGAYYGSSLRSGGVPT